MRCYIPLRVIEYRHLVGGGAPIPGISGVEDSGLNDEAKFFHIGNEKWAVPTRRYSLAYIKYGADKYSDHISPPLSSLASGRPLLQI